MTRTLTVIPAKLGSTRLPRKNVLPLGGRPLLAWSVRAALESGVCGEVMVSTESGEVAALAREAGARVPFMRPAHLGRDPHGVVDVCNHVLDAYGAMGRDFETLVILLPTSPLRTATDIVACMDAFRNKGARFLMSVCRFEHDPYRAMHLHEDGLMTRCFPDAAGAGRKDFPQGHRVNGAVCIVDVAAFREAGTYYGEPLHAHVMPWDRSVDIDTEADFAFAEYLLQRGSANHG